jgi:hypothetical protein
MALARDPPLGALAPEGLGIVINDGCRRRANRALPKSQRCDLAKVLGKIDRFRPRNEIFSGCDIYCGFLAVANKSP